MKKDQNITLEEVLELVEFERDANGVLRVLHVRGDVDFVGGDVGRVGGDVVRVGGDVIRVGGDVGRVRGYVWGVVKD
jgi:hypothetical protein